MYSLNHSISPPDLSSKSLQQSRNKSNNRRVLKLCSKLAKSWLFESALVGETWAQKLERAPCNRLSQLQKLNLNLCREKGCFCIGIEQAAMPTTFCHYCHSFKAALRKYLHRLWARSCPAKLLPYAWLQLNAISTDHPAKPTSC